MSTKVSNSKHEIRTANSGFTDHAGLHVCNLKLGLTAVNMKLKPQYTIAFWPPLAYDAYQNYAIPEVSILRANQSC